MMKNNVVVLIAGLESDGSDFLERNIELFVRKQIHIGCHSQDAD
jgi:hypothetical protein